MVNTYGEPVNLHRTSRHANATQRRLLTLRDQGCVFPGCDKPPAHCQAHHLHYWSHHGHTDLDNLALVCWFHHHLIHEDNWQLHRTPATPPNAAHPTGTPPGWQATAPDGHQLRQHRQPAA